MTRTTADWDVLVVGRSYAGLSAALNLGRTRRSVLLAGSGASRNDAVLHAHGLLAQDGASPAAIIEQAEHELERYPTVELVDGRVSDIHATDGGFRATIAGRATTAAKVILATGVNDNPPPIPGLAEHWGRGVFTCPFCDGYEHGDTPLVVIGSPQFAAHLGRLLTRWSEDVTVQGVELDPADDADLAAHGVRIDRRPIDRVLGDDGRVNAIEVGGEKRRVGAIFVAAMPVPNAGLAAALGCARDDRGFVVVDAMRRTSVDGVWAIGDLANPRANMSMAIADGVIAGVDCHTQLFDAEWAVSRVSVGS